jgi:predicted dehydrogenase
VIVEKPVTATSAEMRDLISIAQEKKLVIAPYHNRRFDGDFRTVRSLIENGKVALFYAIKQKFPCLSICQLGELVDFESR